MTNLVRSGMAGAWSLALAGTLAMTAPQEAPAAPQKPVPAKSQPAPPPAAVKKVWAPTQVLPLTCAQAWVTSGKSYTGLLGIVETMAAVSLANRELTFPDTKEAGLDAGNGIAADCKNDPDGLLFSIVDKHVRRVAEGAAGQVPSASAPQGQDLAGTTWRVTRYNNGKQAVVSVLEGTTLTLEFAADGRLSGAAGCNRFTGAYTSSGGSFKPGNVAATQKMCVSPDGVMDQEAAFLKALATAASARVDADRLELRTAEGALAVTAIRRQAPAVS